MPLCPLSLLPLTPLLFCTLPALLSIKGRSIREIAPLLYACIPKQRRKRRTVTDELQAYSWARDIDGTIGIQELGQYLQLWHSIEHTTLTAKPDRLRWTWNASGICSVQSA